MEQLTKKQIDDRAYYAKNAERIKKQKRDSYAKTKKHLGVTSVVAPDAKKTSEVKRMQSAAKDHARTLSARSRIENLLFERELASY